MLRSRLTPFSTLNIPQPHVKCRFMSDSTVKWSVTLARRPVDASIPTRPLAHPPMIPNIRVPSLQYVRPRHEPRRLTTPHVHFMCQDVTVELRVCSAFRFPSTAEVSTAGACNFGLGDHANIASRTSFLPLNVACVDLFDTS